MEPTIVKIIFNVSQFFCVSVPNLFNYRGITIVYKIYSILVCLLLLILSIVTIYGRFLYIFHARFRTSVLLDFLLVLSTTITNITSIIVTILIHNKNMVRIVKNLKHIHWRIQEQFKISPQLPNTRLFTTLFILLEIVLFVCVLGHFLIELFWKDVSYYGFIVLLHFNFFIMSLTVFQIYYFSIAIRGNFETINAKLAMFNCKNNQSTSDMRVFVKLYDGLCDTIELISKSYGIQIVFVCFVIILNLIVSLNWSMKTALGLELVDNTWSVLFVVFDTTESFICLVFGVILAVSCNLTIREANNTSTICYKILLDLPIRTQFEYQEIVKNDLLLLAEHLNQKRIEFSAADFFPVDHTMLYMIFGSITAYLVVVLQFQ